MNNTTEYFDAICQVTDAISTTNRYEDLLDLVVKKSAEMMDGKAAALFLADEENGYFVNVANTGLSEDYLHANPMPIEPIEKTILKDGYLSVKDAATNERIPNRQAKIDEGIASFLSVPVLIKGEMKGALTLYTAEPRDFSPEDVSLLKILANEGGIAIERAKLIKNILAYAKLFKTISENINSSLDIKHILNALTCDICAPLEIQGSVIRLKDEDTDELKLVASCGVSQPFLDKGPIYSEKGFAKVMGGESLIFDDIDDASLIQYPDAFKKEGIQSILSVPIKTKDSVIGILNLYAKNRERFTRGVIEIAEALAIQGGIAIQNASMYLNLNETKESLEKDIWGYRSWF